MVDSFTATYPKSSVIILDTTYFSRTFGVMLFQDASSGKILYGKFVKNETNRDYLDGLRYIAERGTMMTPPYLLIVKLKILETFH